MSGTSCVVTLNDGQDNTRDVTGSFSIARRHNLVGKFNVSAAEHRRIDIAVGISYADDLDLAERVATEAIESLEHTSPEREVQVLFREFGSSSIDLEVRFWVPYAASPATFLEGRSSAIKAIKRAFDDAGLSIPFPIRTVDFAIKGGAALEQQLESFEEARRAS